LTLVIGSIRQYVRSNEGVDRLKLLVDVTEGLSYLHSANVVHGNLKGNNILVDDKGTACLCDFGLSAMVATLHAHTSASVTGSPRWMAPELFDRKDGDPGNSRPSEMSDIYALGMVFIEVFTGEIPFRRYQEDGQIFHHLMTGGRPVRPAHTLALGFSDSLWELVEMCWHADKFKRPSASFVLSQLYKASLGPHGNSHAFLTSGAGGVPALVRKKPPVRPSVRPEAFDEDDGAISGAPDTSVAVHTSRRKPKDQESGCCVVQ